MAKVYVGTYKKYNNGNLAGAWLDLADYTKYGDFLAACKRLHKDERQPEYMIQDTEGFPDGLSCMEWLSEQDFNDVKAAMQEEETACLTIVDYSDKAFAVIGDTKAVKDDLKKLGGRFNGKLSCGAGWIFSNRVRQEVEKFIASGKVTEREKTPASGSQFTAWLKEFADGLKDSDKKYYLKEYSGAILLRGGYYLIDKPHIENKFCFHDEGPDYEFYKELMEDKQTKLAEYFKSENLSVFDNHIERITKGDFGDCRVWINTKSYKSARAELCFYSSWGQPEGDYELCTEDEKKLILEGLQFGRGLFEKRLDAYLKRYGTSKLHTWTYWADA